MKLLYLEVRCREWNILLMEHYIESRIDGEKWYIIDKDNCEIYWKKRKISLYYYLDKCVWAQQRYILC